MVTANEIGTVLRDEAVGQSVSRLLASRHYPAFRQLEVEVCHGAVTLSGHLGSYHEKQVAITLSQHVAGVLMLIDRIDVSSV